MEAAITYCSKCACILDGSNERFDEQGKRLKTCKKHIKKRQLPGLDQWASFIFEVKIWSHAVSFYHLALISLPCYWDSIRTKTSCLTYIIILTLINYLSFSDDLWRDIAMVMSIWVTSIKRLVSLSDTFERQEAIASVKQTSKRCTLLHMSFTAARTLFGKTTPRA